MIEICHIIMIIQDWMKKLGYLEGSSKWIRLYHFFISEYNKKLIAKAFCILCNENNKCTILITTNLYKMNIDNLDIKLVMQWNFLLLFDLLIQQIGCIKKKQSNFFVFYF